MMIALELGLGVVMTKLGLIIVALSLSLLSSFCQGGSYLSDVPQCMSIITSVTGKNGSFSSPNYPHPYPQRTHCRYDLIGSPKERVQVVFTDFNLYHPEKDTDGCNGADVLSAFVYNDGHLARIEDFCGISIPLAIMSNGNKLTLEFNAPTSSRINRGFSALYFFVTDFGIRTGRQKGDDCIFIFNSTETSNGTFTSPNYPGFYPRDTECNYFFQGTKNEHVELYFTYFHIDGVEPCDEDTYSDYVEFSNYKNVDRKFDRKCGTLKELKINSDRKFFRVTFRSNNRYDATGFQATYQFSDKSNQLTLRNSRSSGAGRSMIDCSLLLLILGILDMIL